MSESTISANICPKCGGALPSTATAGLCPRCLMAEAMVPTQPDTTPTAQPPLPPEQIAPHFPQLEILECLGRGGMGVVYKARQRSLGRFVALKLLAPERVRDPKFADRFTREAQALAALNHPNIVTIHDFGQAGGFYYLLMEFVDGANLRELLRARKFTPEEALAIVPPLCDALQVAHDRGIVHRDIKPENLLLDKAGRIKVADFGIAKMLGPVGAGAQAGEPATPEDATQAAIGTPAYSAPEQKTDPQRADNRADIYSLGVVFYEMLTGELPGKRIEPPSKKVHIDVRLDAVVLRALEKTPELRWQTAEELRTQVETIGAGNPTPVMMGTSSRASTRKSVKKVGIIAAAVFCLVAACVSAVYWRELGSPLILKLIPQKPPSFTPAQNTQLSAGQNPQLLKELPTEQVVQAGLSEPQQPWAWEELQDRARRGVLDQHQVETLMTNLTAWVSLHYPHGYSAPTYWMGEMLQTLNQQHLVSETNALAFLKALRGEPTLELLPRLRERDKIKQGDLELRKPWDEQLLGFEMLNHIQSIRVDGRPIKFDDAIGRHWNQQRFLARLESPPLTTGPHMVQCDVVSAFVPASDIVGLDPDAPPEDWPRAKLRWMRSCQATVTVYPKDAVIVALSEDPALEPVKNGALTLKQVIVRRAGAGLNAVLQFDFGSAVPKPAPRTGVDHTASNSTPPFGMDVTLGIGGRSIQCGSLAGWENTMTGDQEKTAKLDALDPNVRKADVVLTPNPKLVEEAPLNVDRIWGKEIVLHDVPLKRQDLETGVSPVAFQQVQGERGFSTVFAEPGPPQENDQPSKSTPPPGLVELKLKWTPDKRYVTDFDLKQNMALLLWGRSNSVDQAITLGYQVGTRVLRETPDSGHELEMKFLSVRMGIKMGGQTILDFDSAHPSAEDQTNGLGAVFGEIAGSRLRAFLNGSNDVERLEGVDELVQHIQSVPQTDPLTEDIKKIFGPVFFQQFTNPSAFLPRHRVQPGDTWSYPREFSVAGTGIEVWEFKVLFQSWEMHENHRCARLQFQGIMKVKPDPNSKRDETIYHPRDGVSEGVAWFDPELGQMVEANIKNDVNVDKVPRNPDGTPSAAGQPLVTTQRHQVATIKLER